MLLSTWFLIIIIYNTRISSFVRSYAPNKKFCSLSLSFFFFLFRRVRETFTKEKGCPRRSARARSTRLGPTNRTTTVSRRKEISKSRPKQKWSGLERASTRNFLLEFLANIYNPPRTRMSARATEKRSRIFSSSNFPQNLVCNREIEFQLEIFLVNFGLLLDRKPILISFFLSSILRSNFVLVRRFARI